MGNKDYKVHHGPEPAPKKIDRGETKDFKDTIAGHAEGFGDIAVEKIAGNSLGVDSAVNQDALTPF